MEFLKVINRLLTESGINYTLDLVNDVVRFPFWIGDFQQTGYSYEQGCDEYLFNLTGTNKGSFTKLMNEFEKIKSVLKNHSEITENKNGVSIEYDSMLMIPSQDEQIKRIEAHFIIKEWSVK